MKMTGVRLGLAASWTTFFSSTLLAVSPHPQTFDKALSFEPCQDDRCSCPKWMARGHGYQISIGEDGVSIMVREGSGSTPSMASPNLNRISALPTPLSETVLHMQLHGGRPWTDIKGTEPTGGYSHYFIGNNPAKWRTQVPQFARLKVTGVYKGIDLILYSDGGDLEYDFAVAPGADPHQIRLSFAGAKDLRLDSGSGDIIVTTAHGGELRTLRPRVYQQLGDTRVEVAGNYQVMENGQASFQLARYDESRPLVIDPTVKFTTFLEGNGEDVATGIAVDSSGNSYIVGYTFSTDFPGVDGLPDIAKKVCSPGPNGATLCPPYAFVTKLSPTGAVLFSTYLGGDGLDLAHAVAVESNGTGFDGVYVTGTTYSGSTFPQTTTQYAPGSGEVFVTKLHLNGTLYYSTLFGGSDIDDGYAIAVDSNHCAYVAGLTHSVDFVTSAYFSSPLRAMQEVLHGPEDAFVTKVDAFGFLNEGYSTYLGGSDFDHAQGISVDANGCAYVTGVTASSDFPTLGPSTSLPGTGTVTAFVTKLLANGSGAIYSIYLGRGGADEGNAIAVDGAGNAFVAGDTLSGSFQTTAAALQQFKPSQAVKFFSGFVTQVNPQGFPAFSTYLGGSDDASCTSIGLNSSGEVYVGGWTRSTSGFPGAPSLTPNPTAGFLTKMPATLNAASFTTLLGAQINAITVPKPTGHRLILPPVVPTTTEIYTTGLRFRPGTDPVPTNVDAFVVRVEDATARSIFTPLPAKMTR